jgi:hypothetical protein
MNEIIQAELIRPSMPWLGVLHLSLDESIRSLVIRPSHVKGKTKEMMHYRCTSCHSPRRKEESLSNACTDGLGDRRGLPSSSSRYHCMFLQNFSRSISGIIYASNKILSYLAQANQYCPTLAKFVHPHCATDLFFGRSGK